MSRGPMYSRVGALTNDKKVSGPYLVASATSPALSSLSRVEDTGSSHLHPHRLRECCRGRCRLLNLRSGKLQHESCRAYLTTLHAKESHPGRQYFDASDALMWRFVICTVWLNPVDQRENPTTMISRTYLGEHILHPLFSPTASRITPRLRMDAPASQSDHSHGVPSPNRKVTRPSMRRKVEVEKEKKNMSR